MLERGDDPASRRPPSRVGPGREARGAGRGILPPGSPDAAGAAAGAAAVTAAPLSPGQSAARAQICKWRAGAAGVPLAGAGGVALGE